MEKYVADFVYNIKVGNQNKKPEALSIKERTAIAYDNVKDIVEKVWLYVIIGVTLGGIFHGYAPEGILAQYAGKDNLLAVPIAVVIGVAPILKRHGHDSNCGKPYWKRASNRHCLSLSYGSYCTFAS